MSTECGGIHVRTKPDGHVWFEWRCPFCHNLYGWEGPYLGAMLATRALHDCARPLGVPVGLMEVPV